MRKNKRPLRNWQGMLSRALGKAVAASVGLAAAAVLNVGDADAQIVHRSGETPDYHVVQEGDTLYDLSGSYYGDVYQWPKMWGYNPHVTNPHWIYPGDIVYLRAPKREEVAKEDGDVQTIDQTSNGAAGARHLPVVGFITKDRLEYVGRISASPKEATMLSPHDVAWVGWGEDGYTDKEEEELEASEKHELKDPGEVKVGDTFAIVREEGEIESSDGDDVGQKYLVIGSLRVTEKSEKYFDTAMIEQSWREIYRGDLLVPYERQMRVVSPVKSDQDMVAEIVDSIQARFEFGESYYVFVNKGAKDGVRPGNRFFVYQRAEGMDSPGTEPDEMVPWRRVGQVLVVDVRENYSTAVITDSTREIQIGDRLEMYAGY